MTSPPSAKKKEKMVAQCWAISGKHKQGQVVEILNVGFFLLAIDISLSCGHMIRFNLDKSENRFQFITQKESNLD